MRCGRASRKWRGPCPGRSLLPTTETGQWTESRDGGGACERPPPPVPERLPGRKGMMRCLGSFWPPSTGNLSSICIWGDSGLRPRGELRGAMRPLCPAFQNPAGKASPGVSGPSTTALHPHSRHTVKAQAWARGLPPGRGETQSTPSGHQDFQTGLLLPRAARSLRTRPRQDLAGSRLGHHRVRRTQELPSGWAGSTAPGRAGRVGTAKKTHRLEGTETEAGHCELV